ncbi:hypothetical protein [Epilithonimonas xixisoli]|uniref:Lipoprotein n=1 Tax=Epilithonimonas xixisoli TaxID=1476462 RepID=A0A4R8IFX5_9FLAO|nr:hypothetical protein [Epilithonimonas xixisoli]TDX84640.1 hypothetical protein B0I22_2271 [Epilithonimonas xixisoli]
MKKYFYLFILSFSLISCYTYRVKAESDEKTKEAPAPAKPVKSNEVASKEVASANFGISDVESAIPKKSKVTSKSKITNPRPTTIEGKLEPTKFYKIEAAGRYHKIQVDKWESDTLVAHVIHKPKKILKFHKNQINQSTIAERRFSQPVADIITVAAYTAIGVGIWTLVR